LCPQQTGFCVQKLEKITFLRENFFLEIGNIGFEKTENLRADFSNGDMPQGQNAPGKVVKAKILPKNIKFSLERFVTSFEINTIVLDFNTQYDQF
jgi:hypothetical protein